MNNVKHLTYKPRKLQRDAATLCTKHRTKTTEKYDEFKQHEPHNRVTFGDFDDGVCFLLDKLNRPWICIVL